MVSLDSHTGFDGMGRKPYYLDNTAICRLVLVITPSSLHTMNQNTNAIIMTN